jgi:hypothetical protein
LLAGVDVEVVDVDVDVETDVLLFAGGAVLVICLLTFVHIRPWKVVKFGSDIYNMEMRWYSGDRGGDGRLDMWAPVRPRQQRAHCTKRK